MSQETEEKAKCDTVKQRYEYLDVLKGILILLVVIGHFNDECVKQGIYDLVSASIGSVEVLYSPFYMAAFFVVTGFCSNFDKNLKDFVISNLKTLILATITIVFISNAILHLSQGETSLLPYFHFGLGYIIIHGGPWFVFSLFVSKIVYYFIHNYVANDGYKMVSLIFLAAIGFFIKEKINIPNVWSFQQALLLTCNLYVGQFLKRNVNRLNNKIIIYGLLTYVFVYVFVWVFGMDIPYIAHKMKVSIATLLPYFVLSITGSFVFWGVFKNLDAHNKILSTMGKMSLVVYILNGRLLSVFISMFSGLFNQNVILSFFVYVLILSLLFLVSYLIWYILNLKYLKFFLGKF